MCVNLFGYGKHIRIKYTQKMAIISMDEAREEQKGKKKRKAQRIYESPTEEEFIKILAQVKKLHHEAGMLLSDESGLRISEVINLQPEDIDLKAKTIFIRQGKGKKDRIVNTPKHFKEKHVKCFPVKITARAFEAVFLRLSLKAGVNKIIAYYSAKGKQIPIYKYHWHSLRHHFATRALKNGVPVNYVQTLLGHASLATTNKYTKANPLDAIQAVLEKGV